MRTITAPNFEHFPDRWHLSPVLDTGDFIFLSGVTGYHPDGTVDPNPEAQFRDTFEFLGANLEAAGLSFDHVVELTSYHVDLRRHIDTFIRVKDAYIAAPYPAWTAIGIVDLITPGTIIELRVIAKRR